MKKIKALMLSLAMVVAVGTAFAFNFQEVCEDQNAIHYSSRITPDGTPPPTSPETPGYLGPLSANTFTCNITFEEDCSEVYDVSQDAWVTCPGRFVDLTK